MGAPMLMVPAQWVEALGRQDPQLASDAVLVLVRQLGYVPSGSICPPPSQPRSDRLPPDRLNECVLAGWC